MTGKWNVIIADDDHAIVRALTVRCEKMGLNVVTARNGLELVLKIKNGAPDLLILDIDMPHATGFRVCERLRELQMAQFPVIVLTGQSDEDTIRRCEEFGATFVLKSHDTWDTLKALICELLQTRDQSEQGAAVAPAKSEETTPAAAAPDGSIGFAANSVRGGMKLG